MFFNQPPHRASGIVIFFVVIMVLVFCFLPEAKAHNVKVFAFVEGLTVTAEGYFADGRRAADSRIEVFDDKGTMLMEGKTDGEGIFTFQVPRPANLKIVLTASMGHRTEFKIAKDKFANITSPSDGNPDETANAMDTQATDKLNDEEISIAEKAAVPEIGQINEPSMNVTTAELQKIIAQTLDAKLQPVIAALLALNQKGISATEIFGGIGYIIGLFGIAMFFKSGRKL